MTQSNPPLAPLGFAKSPRSLRGLGGDLLVGAVLAALLFKFASVMAPAYQVMMTGWSVTALYLYFVVVRVAYAMSFAAEERQVDAAASRGVAKQSFATALRAHRSTILTVCACVVGLASLLDMGLAAGSSSARAGAWVLYVFYAFANIVWLGFAPPLLIGVGLWAREGRFRPARVRELISLETARTYLSWAVVAFAIYGLYDLATDMLYWRFRAFVVSVIPSSRAIYLYSAAFYACLIALAIVLQALYASLMSARLLRAENDRAAEVARRLSRRRIDDEWERVTLNVMFSIAVGGTLYGLIWLTLSS